MTNEEIVLKTIEFIESFPYDENICFFIILREVVGFDEAMKLEQNGDIWKLMNSFYKECDKRKILLKHENHYGAAIGLPFNIGFAKVKELKDDPDEVVAKKIFKLFKKYPFYKRTSIFELIHECYQKDEADKLYKDLGWQIEWWFNNFAENSRLFDISSNNFDNACNDEFLNARTGVFWKVPRPDRRRAIPNKGIKEIKFEIDWGFRSFTNETLILSNNKITYSKKCFGPYEHILEEEIHMPEEAKQRYLPIEWEKQMDGYFENPLVAKAITILDCNKPQDQLILDGPSCGITIVYNNGKEKQYGFMFGESADFRDVPLRNAANYLLESFPSDMPVPFFFEHMPVYEVCEQFLDSAIKQLELGYKMESLDLTDWDKVMVRPVWLERIMYSMVEHNPLIPDCLTVDLWTREEQKRLTFEDICTLISWFVWLDCTCEIIILQNVIDDGRLLSWLKQLKKMYSCDDDE